MSAAAIALATLSTALFFASFHFSRILSHSSIIITTALNALQIINDNELQDIEKEQALQTSTVVLFKQLFLILSKLALCLIIASIPAGLTIYSGNIEQHELSKILTSPYYWAVNTLGFLAVFQFRR